MDEPIKNVEEFFTWTKQLEGGLLVYRGMADADWEVSASAYRRIGKLPEAQQLPIVFQNSMKQLLESAGLHGFRERQGRSHSDLELLAELQHNGAATCMIDFTTNALIALWFTCWGNSEEDGKVIAMATGKTERFSIVAYPDLQKPIETFLHQNKLWKWVPRHLSNRIVAQQSVFVFGEGEIAEKDYESIKINGSSKKKIIEELEERFGITEQYLFSDFAGFALSNAHDRPYSDYKAEDHLYLGLRFHSRETTKRQWIITARPLNLILKMPWRTTIEEMPRRKSGDYQGAIADYNKAIELNPQFAEAYNNQGVAKGESGDYQGAIADLDKAIEINPQLTEAYLNRGIAKGTSDDYLGAISDFDKAIELNPQYAEAYYNRGIAKGDSGDYQEAIADYNKAIELNPRYAEAYNNRGIAKMNSGDYQEAIVDYNKAIELDPQDAGAYYSRGIAKYGSDDYQEAIADFDKTIVLNPQFAGAYNGRGIAKADSSDYQGAIDDYNKAIELNPKDARAYNNRGVAKGASGDNQGAIADFDKAIELDPQFADAYLNRGIAKQDSGNYKGAIADFDKAIELNPQYAEAYHNRGIAKQASGDETGAQEDFAKAKGLANKTLK